MSKTKSIRDWTDDDMVRARKHFKVTDGQEASTMPFAMLLFRKYTDHVALDKQGGRDVTYKNFGEYMDEAIRDGSPLSNQLSHGLVSDLQAYNILQATQAEIGADIDDGKKGAEVRAAFEERYASAGKEVFDKKISSYKRNLNAQDQLMSVLDGYYKKDISDIAAKVNTHKVTTPGHNPKQLVEMVRYLKNAPVFDEGYDMMDSFMQSKYLKKNPYHNKMVKAEQLRAEYAGNEGGEPTIPEMAFPNYNEGQNNFDADGNPIDDTWYEKAMSIGQDVFSIPDRLLYTGAHMAAQPDDVSKHLSWKKHLATPAKYNSPEQQLMQDIGIGGFGGGTANKMVKGAYNAGKKLARAGDAAKLGDRLNTSIKAGQKVKETKGLFSKATKKVGDFAKATGRKIDEVATYGTDDAATVLSGNKYLNTGMKVPAKTRIAKGAVKGFREGILPSAIVAGTKFNDDKDAEGMFDLAVGPLAAGAFGGAVGLFKGDKLSGLAKELGDKDYSKKVIRAAADETPTVDSRTTVAQIKKVNEYADELKNEIGKKRNAAYDELADEGISGDTYQSVEKKLKPKYTEDMSIEDAALFEKEVAKYTKPFENIKKIEGKQGDAAEEAWNKYFENSPEYLESINKRAFKAEKMADIKKFGDELPAIKEAKAPSGQFKEFDKGSTKLARAADRTADPDKSRVLSQASLYLRDASDGMAENAVKKYEPLMMSKDPAAIAKVADKKQALKALRKSRADFKKVYKATEDLPRGDAPVKKQEAFAKNIGTNRANISTNAASMEKTLKDYKSQMHMFDMFNDRYKLNIDPNKLSDMNYVTTAVANAARNKMPIRDGQNFMNIVNKAAELSLALRGLRAAGAATGSLGKNTARTGTTGLFNVATDPEKGSADEIHEEQINWSR